MGGNTRDGSTPFSRIESPRISGAWLARASETQADLLGRMGEISVPGHEDNFLIAEFERHREMNRVVAPRSPRSSACSPARRARAESTPTVIRSPCSSSKATSACACSASSKRPWRRAATRAARPPGQERMLDAAAWLLAQSSAARSEPSSATTSLINAEVSRQRIRPLLGDEVRYRTGAFDLGRTSGSWPLRPSRPHGKPPFREWARHVHAGALARRGRCGPRRAQHGLPARDRHQPLGVPARGDPGRRARHQAASGRRAGSTSSRTPGWREGWSETSPIASPRLRRCSS